MELIKDNIYSKIDKKIIESEKLNLDQFKSESNIIVVIQSHFAPFFTVPLIIFNVIIMIPIILVYKLIGLCFSKNRISSTDEDQKYEPSNDRTQDLIIFGATGGCGQFALMYYKQLLDNNKLDGKKIAIAGRSKSKLESVKTNQMADTNSNLDIIVASIENYDSLVQLCLQTKVILSTVGPQLKQGEPVIKACAHTGTNQTDITGEGPFIDYMAKKYHDIAIKNKSILLPFSGFDCVPQVNAVKEGVLHFKTKFNINPKKLIVNVLNSGFRLPQGTLPTAFNLFNNDWIFEHDDNSSFDFLTVIDSIIPTYNADLKAQSMISPGKGINSKCVGEAIKSNDEFGQSKDNKLEYVEESIASDWFMVALSTNINLILVGTLLFNPLTRQFLELIYNCLYVLTPLDTFNYRSLVKTECIDNNNNKDIKYHVYLGDPGLLQTSKAMQNTGCWLADEFENSKTHNYKGKYGFCSTEIVDGKQQNEFEQIYGEDLNKIL